MKSVIFEPLRILIAKYCWISCFGLSVLNMNCESSSDRPDSIVSGMWQSDCRNSDARSSRKSMVFQGLVMTRSTEIFTDLNCSTPSYSTSLISEFSTSEPNASGVQQIDTVVRRFLWNVLNEDHISPEYNQRGWCGYTNWTVNEPKDCAGRVGDDQIFPSKGDEGFNILKVKNNTLLLGISDSNSRQGRPSELDYEEVFFKQ